MCSIGACIYELRRSMCAPRTAHGAGSTCLARALVGWLCGSRVVLCCACFSALRASRLRLLSQQQDTVSCSPLTHLSSPPALVVRYDTILVCGGSSYIKGLPARIAAEVSAISPLSFLVRRPEAGM